jgi:tetratricopeptide (TPR) repeat protein
MSRFACLLTLLAAPLMGAEAPPPLPCEPSAACALQMTRDTALRNVATTRNLGLLELSLEALAWSGKFDAIEDPELRLRIAAMLKQVTALQINDRTYLHTKFAAAMAAYGFVDEAQSLIAGSRSPKGHDPVRAALACSYARRGSFREAFSTIEAIGGLGEYDAFDEVADCIARTADPEFARSIAGQVPDTSTNAERVARIVALTEQAAGHFDAARDAALSIEDDALRRNALYDLAMRYRRNANYKEAAATELLRREVVKKISSDGWSQRDVVGSLLDDLVNLGAHAEIQALLDDVPAEIRSFAFLTVLKKESDSGVIRDIARRVTQLTGSEQQGLQNDLLMARVRVGDLKPGEALGFAADQQQLALELLGLAGNLGADQRGLAQEALRAAIAAKGKRPDGFWTDVAWAQARTGLLQEAHQTIDREIRDAGARGHALAGVSGSEAAQGRHEDARRTRARAVRLLKSGGSSADDFSMAVYLLDAKCHEAAHASLLAALRSKKTPANYDYLPKKLIMELAKRGDFLRAMELAQAASDQLDGAPEPFADVYSAAKGLPNMIIRHWIR